MKMTLAEATAECERWLAYLDRQKEKSIKLQQIAADRRNGTCSEEEGRRRVRAIDSGVTVYDGGNLSEAVKVLLKQLKKPAPDEPERGTATSEG